MKLYAYQPNGHGQQSFFVMAENEQAAKAAVENKIETLLEKSNWFSYYHFEGWNTGFYILTEVGAGEVILNDND